MVHSVRPLAYQPPISLGLLSLIIFSLRCCSPFRPSGVPVDTAETSPRPSTPPDPTATEPPILDLTALSGVWTGTDTLTAIGECLFTGGVRSVESPVRMIWKASETGALDIELPDWRGAHPYSFSGEVQPDLDLSLELRSSASCNGSLHAFTALYVGSIQLEDGVPVLEMEAIEEWCPGTCIFHRYFVVRQRDAPP